MITAFLAGFSSHYEGEDIEVRYGIYKDEILLGKEALLVDYQKPAIVGLVSLEILLAALEKYKDSEIVVIVNDAALCEIVRGTSTTKNKDVIGRIEKTRKKMEKFRSLTLKDVGKNAAEFAKWQEVLIN